MTLELYIITVFCLVEAKIKEILGEQRLRQCGSAPKLFDSEVLCMEIVGEYLGIDCDKKIWEYFKTHWIHFFPKIPSRTSFSRQCSNLINLKQKIHELLIKELHGDSDNLHMIDGFPISICLFARAHRCKLFQESAAYGYCSSKREHYYGFHGNVVINFEGVISGFSVTPANIDERKVVFEITENIHGLLIGDKGYIDKDLQDELAKEREINFQTALRDNMKDNRDKKFVKTLISTRRKVETVIGQLADRFHAEYTRARDLWHLGNRFIRKILSHNIAIKINKSIGNGPIKFDDLVSC